MTDCQFIRKDMLFGLVIKEGEMQVKKWGVQNRDPFEWLAFLTEEVGELAQAISEWEFMVGHEREIIKEAIQVATLSLKIAEMFTFRLDERDNTETIGDTQ
jgi:NTP pyrophosphatase (non-canonical NTP hydrolase)